MPLLASDTNIEMMGSPSITSLDSEEGDKGRGNSHNIDILESSIESSIESKIESKIGFQGGMDRWEGCVLIAPRNFDRIFQSDTPFIATIVKSIITLFSQGFEGDDDDVHNLNNGRELLSTHDDDDDSDEDEDSDDDNDEFKL